MSQHSHPIGLANLPFTRRGRKARALEDKERRNRAANESDDHTQTPAPQPPPATAETSTANQNVAPQPAVQSQPPTTPAPSTSPSFTSPTSLTAQNAYQQSPTNAYAYPNTMAPQNYAPPQNLSHDRWENMTTMFHSVRENARTHEYPSVSIAALESVLIRMYLESPITYAPQHGMGTAMQTRMQVAGGGGGGVAGTSGEGSRS